MTIKDNPIEMSFKKGYRVSADGVVTTKAQADELAIAFRQCHVDVRTVIQRVSVKTK